MQHEKLLLLAILSVITSRVHAALTLEFTDCGNKQVKALRSETCNTDPCRVPIGGQASVELDFLPDRDAAKVKIAVFASVFGFEMAIPLEDDDACAQGRLSCPIQAGVPQTLRYDLKIADSYFPVSGDVGFRLVGEDEKPIACATISAELYTPGEAHEELPEGGGEQEHQEL